MIFCNYILSYILQYLDIKSFYKILLYLPNIKNELTKSYCLSNNIFTNSNITDYNFMLSYFNNNKIYKCIKCKKNIISDYNLLICSCVSESLKNNISIYPKYHLECLNINKKNTNINTIKCEFCNKTRICFRCHIYS